VVFCSQPKPRKFVLLALVLFFPTNALLRLWSEPGKHFFRYQQSRLLHDNPNLQNEKLDQRNSAR